MCMQDLAIARRTTVSQYAMMVTSAGVSRIRPNPRRMGITIVVFGAGYQLVVGCPDVVAFTPLNDINTTGYRSVHIDDTTNPGVARLELVLSVDNTDEAVLTITEYLADAILDAAIQREVL